jgi:arylformamidase
MKLIDVSVPLDAATLPTYPNNTPFSLEPVKRVARGDSSNVSTLHMSAHTGTHVDAPRHFFDDGAGTEALPLEMLLGRTRVIEVTSRTGIAAEDLKNIDLAEDVRLLIKTHNSRLWGSPEFHADYVGVTESAARHLVDHGIKVLGVDYLSVEKFRTPGAPAHHVLLGAGTIVIEGLNLMEVDPGVYEMICLPLRIVGADGAPARVLLRRS